MLKTVIRENDFVPVKKWKCSINYLKRKYSILAMDDEIAWWYFRFCLWIRTCQTNCIIPIHFLFQGGISIRTESIIYQIQQKHTIDHNRIAFDVIHYGKRGQIWYHSISMALLTMTVYKWLSHLFLLRVNLIHVSKALVWHYGAKKMWKQVNWKLNTQCTKLETQPPSSPKY